jgi:hypothetical protein
MCRYVSSDLPTDIVLIVGDVNSIFIRYNILIVCNEDNSF